MSETFVARTITMQVRVAADRMVQIPLPRDVPVGQLELMITVQPTRSVPALVGGTAADMARSPLFGLWADRHDIDDSLAYARRLRAQAERREYDPA